MAGHRHYRLKLFWGEVNKRHIGFIKPFIEKGEILDLGCGSGSTAYEIQKGGFGKVTGLDFSNDEISKAKEWYPDVDFYRENAEKMPFPNEKFNTIILRDSLHHFYEEADFEKVKKEINRVLKPGGRLIFLDPNINAMIRFLRRTAKHIDAECDFEAAIEIINSLGYTVQHKSFNTVYSLPLSGGYVYKNFVPHNRLLYKVLIGMEIILEKIINGLNLGRYLCWRYLIVCTKP